ncbi:dihydroneopterin aldolase [Candidatus Parcubacteria bacterium]|nr:dihydroneopterin aldolase [Candidatus Parcubacteria bacterium]
MEAEIKSKIKLTGIKAIGHHGVNDGEQDRPQTFYIDVELVAEVSNDDIGSTQDYRQISELVRRVVEQKKFKLIETMAYSIAKKIYSLGKVSGLRIVVHKPAAAKSLLVEDVTAEYTIRGNLE